MRIKVQSVDIHDAPFRSPFKFGAAVITELRVPHTTVELETSKGTATGMGAMPLANAWSYPGPEYGRTLATMEVLLGRIETTLNGTELPDDVFAASAAIRAIAIDEAGTINREADLESPIPDLCALVTASSFDLAMFDAWGKAQGGNTYQLLRDAAAPPTAALHAALKPAPLAEVLSAAPAQRLAIYHVVGGLDPLTPGEVAERAVDGLPDNLADWMARDGLTHFKIKLQGKDTEWDFQRIKAIDEAVSSQAAQLGCGEAKLVYSLDLNEQCPSGEVLAGLLERLKSEVPRAFSRISFVEQPTSRNAPIGETVHAAAALKPVVLDEGLTGWEELERALDMGYNGVCLKTCKGLGFSLQAAAVAKAHNLYLCVQDLTCPGISFVESAGLAARVGVDGLEANARQFCPEANRDAASKYPDLFLLKNGQVDPGSLTGNGLL